MLEFRQASGHNYAGPAPVLKNAILCDLFNGLLRSSASDTVHGIKLLAIKAEAEGNAVSMKDSSKPSTLNDGP